jgi:hypothetical protein
MKKSNYKKRTKHVRNYSKITQKKQSEDMAHVFEKHILHLKKSIVEIHVVSKNIVNVN